MFQWGGNAKGGRSHTSFFSTTPLSALICYERGLFSIVVCSERVRYERVLLSTCMVCYERGLL